jgi:hypothetical protein
LPSSRRSPIARVPLTPRLEAAFIPVVPDIARL